MRIQKETDTVSVFKESVDLWKIQKYKIFIQFYWNKHYSRFLSKLCKEARDGRQSDGLQGLV
jgi:hypothetical protein